nr:MAG TPA: hypothetical protein [Caudoviricetes sp.]
MLLKPVKYTFSNVVAVVCLYTFIETPKTCLYFLGNVKL